MANYKVVEKVVRHLLRNLQHLHYRKVTTLYRKSWMRVFCAILKNLRIRILQTHWMHFCRRS